VNVVTNVRHRAPQAFGQISIAVYNFHMATAVRKLDLHVGELVEIDGRCYEVVPDKTGGLTIEPPITPISELYEKRGMKVASPEDFERLTADVPTDGEG
jgi:hypothetical protein